MDVGGFEISPDGQWLAIMASDPETPAERRKTSERNDAKVVGQEAHPQRVWLYSVANHSLIPVSSDARAAASASWSRDSKHLAIVTRPTGNADDLGPPNTLDVMNIATPCPRTRCQACLRLCRACRGRPMESGSPSRRRPYTTPRRESPIYSSWQRPAVNCAT